MVVRDNSTERCYSVVPKQSNTDCG